MTQDSHATPPIGWLDGDRGVFSVVEFGEGHPGIRSAEGPRVTAQPDAAARLYYPYASESFPDVYRFLGSVGFGG